MKGDAKSLTQNFKFNDVEFMRLILETFENLYGGDSIFLAEDQKLIDAFAETFHITQQNSVAQLAKTYKDLAPVREALLKNYSTVFENYLVNEFFMKLYPFSLSYSITDNYGLFLITYKMMELLVISFAVSSFKKNPEKRPPLDLIHLSALITVFCNRVDHAMQFLKKISEHIKDKYDMATLMQYLLQS